METLKRLPGRTWRHFMHDSFRRNSSFLVLGQLLNAGSAFLFWIICARLFETQTVGLATAFVSYAALVATFTTLGMPTTVVRFLPTSKNKPGLFGAAFSLTLATSTLGSAIALAIVHLIAPGLSLVQSSASLIILLITLIIANALSPLADSTLMAHKKGEYILIKYALNSAPRLVLPFLVAGLALSGIVSVFVLLAIVSVTYGVIVARFRLFKGSVRPNFTELLQHRGFALRNYVGGLTGILPSTLVPIIILNNLGAAKAAYFYMPMQMAAFLSVVSGSVSQALVSEASQHEDAAVHSKQLQVAILHLFRVLIPVVLLLISFGWLALRLYGKDYAQHGYAPLIILAVSGLFVGMNWLGDTWLIVQKRMNSFILMNTLNSLLIVGLVFVFSQHGLVPAAFAWLVAQVLTVCIYVSVFMRAQLVGVLSRRMS